jgi:hypothetical protein
MRMREEERWRKRIRKLYLSAEKRTGEVGVGKAEKENLM